MNKVLSLEERLVIQENIKSKMSLGEIARKIGRSKNCIVVEVRKNGGRENYKAIEANEDAKQRRLVHSEKVKIKNKNRDHPLSRMADKIEVLQMQIDILTETIREMKEKI